MAAFSFFWGEALHGGLLIRKFTERWPALALLGVLGLSFTVSGAELTRIGLTREASAAPFLLAVEAGYFKDEGLDPQLTFFKSEAAVSAAVAAGSVDIGLSGLSAKFYSDAAVHGFKVFASRSSEQTGFPMSALLVSKKAHAAGLTGVRGLATARIGVVSVDSSETYGLFKVLARFKMDPSSMRVVPMNSFPGALQALSRNEIDAALLPFPMALQSAGRLGSLLRLSDFAQWQQGVVFTTATNIAKTRGLIERFMRAYQRGTAAYQLNFLSYDDGGDFIPGPAYDSYLQRIGREVHVASDVLARTKTFCDRRANVDAVDVQQQVRFWQDRGQLDKTIAAADLLDLSFIGQEALQH